MFKTIKISVMWPSEHISLFQGQSAWLKISGWPLGRTKTHVCIPSTEVKLLADVDVDSVVYPSDRSSFGGPCWWTSGNQENSAAPEIWRGRNGCSNGTSKGNADLDNMVRSPDAVVSYLVPRLGSGQAGSELEIRLFTMAACVVWR